MIEYLMIVGFLALCYLIFQNRFVRQKRWFVYMSLSLLLVLIVYLIIEAGKQFGIVKLVLLVFALAGILYTAIKRAFPGRQKIEKKKTS